ncbi:hypothetical protein C8Q69DRAFT_448505 [Paecilomyces variotii]|uniref:Uncharacterized protein n=1 Tax=Byssochlamys spectabilis TaxID=264951 RepID=A0A443HI50_BYSSP|nr:hypothetical protein C8Q69DRAFT_448505 [Paecilomyces variotii]KAJ9230660.1 hypothetical protein DTO169E5_8356 [Paecilomyces variotii]KAJ9313424.1 hypothetical protein DTO271D3_6287 [Paecilomyces variotii]KAJ9364761.1 hypothetical protein DTO280E4_1056 [Paecilomyces variotii]RWQ91459.1 hypothetical protein C8Q69DRAFT_448505 [Paecilomyces variotii]
MDLQQRPAASLTSLPIECRQLILRLLPDITTLQTAIRSHSSLYNAFLDQKNAIIKSIVSNIVSFDLLPEVIAVLKSSQIEPWTRGKVLGILHCYLNRRIPSNFEYTVKDAICMQRLHRVIEAFVADFATAALSENPLSGVSEDPTGLPLSDNEKRRLISSFYRFELWTWLFQTRNQDHERKPKETTDFSPEEQWDIFFQKLAPWELEQMYTVHEYLYRELSIPFNEVAAHDVQWGVWSVRYDDTEVWEGDGMNVAKDYYMFRGLNFLRKVITAKGYDDRYRILNPNFDYAGMTLSTIVRSLNLEDDQVPLERYDGENLEAVLGSSFVKDPDPGPAQAWKWTHLKLTRSNFVGCWYMRDLRRRGYVMWDQSRLVRWRFFESPEWQFPDDPDDEDEEHAREEEMERSWAQRRRLYRKGFLGWWSEGDESKLTWRSIEFSSDEEDD